MFFRTFVHVKLENNNMARKRFISEKRYTIHWYRDGFCYRTTHDCPKDYVDDSKRLAKLLGEKIKTELYRVIKHEY